MYFAREAALIRRVHNLAIYDRFQGNDNPSTGASIGSRPIGKTVLLPNGGRDVLGETCVIVDSSVALQNDLGRRIVAYGVEAVPVRRVHGALVWSEDPRREAAFEATVLDDVDSWCGGAARGGGDGGRGGEARVAGAG